MYNLNCCYCKTDFETKWRPKKLPVCYCSKKCANKANPRRRPEGQCATCKKPCSTSRKYCDTCLPIYRESVKVPLELQKEVHRNYKRIRHQRLKAQAIAYKGDRCQICGYNSYLGALHFHHLDPKLKTFTISSRTSSWKKLQPELDKCILLCANHHAEAHAGVLNLKVVEIQRIEL